MSQPYQIDTTPVPDPWTHPATSVQARYDDPRLVTVGAGINREIVLTVGSQEPVFVDAIDLLRSSPTSHSTSCTDRVPLRWNGKPKTVSAHDPLTTAAVYRGRQDV